MSFTRRAQPALLALTAAVAVAATPGEAHARCDDPLLSTCINADTLWPYAGHSRFVGIGGTELLAPNRVGFGLMATYLSRPVRLHVPSPAPLGTDLNAVDDQVNANFLFSYGVTERLELDLVMPLTLGQGGSGTSGLTAGQGLRDTALRDIRFGLAYALVPRDRVDPELAHASDPTRKLRPWALAARFMMSAPIGDASEFASDRGGVYSPALTGDYRRGRWFAGAELGARLRATSEFAGARIGPQGYVALGVGFDILSRDRLAVTAEGRMLPGTAEQRRSSQAGGVRRSEPAGTYIVPAEWTVAVRSAPFKQSDVAFQLGGGGAIPLDGNAPITTPRFRFTLGIVFAPRELDSDGDSIPDRIDACPTVVGERGSPSPGCPAPPPAPVVFEAPEDALPPPLPTPPTPTPAPEATPPAAPTPAPAPEVPSTPPAPAP